MKGLVRQLNFLQQDNVLVVRFDATAAASAAAIRTTDRAVEVTVTTGRAAANSYDVSATGPSAIGLPAAYEPPESYALVLLKYADVSEVVGLLDRRADGQVERRFHSERAGIRVEQPDRQQLQPDARSPRRRARRRAARPVGRRLDRRSTGDSMPSGSGARRTGSLG